MSDPKVTALLTKLLCSHGGRLRRHLLPVYMELSAEQIDHILQDERQRFPVVGEVVLAWSPLRICPQYLINEGHEHCGKLHICSAYLQGKCTRYSSSRVSQCEYSHDMSSRHNQAVISANGISGLSDEEIRVLLLQNDSLMLPEVCWRYVFGRCVLGEYCPRPHFCYYFTRGVCRHLFCKLSHNLVDLGAARLHMSELSIRSFQMLCEVKHTERLKNMYEAVKMEESATKSDRREHRKRKHSEDAPLSKLPRIQEDPTGIQDGLTSSTVSAFRKNTITPPVATTGPVNASPVNVPMIGPSVSQAKPVPFPLQMVDLPSVQPMALTNPSRTVHSLSPSIPQEKPVTPSITGLLTPQPVATYMKTNTPSAAGPINAPSSSYITLPNSPPKGSAVPLKTPVTTSIANQSIPPSIISFMNPRTWPAAGPSTVPPSSSSYTRVLNSPTKRPSVPQEKLANTARPSNSQSTGSFMKVSTPPETSTSTTASSSLHTMLVNSPTKSPSFPLEKPETVFTTRPSNPQTTSSLSSTPSVCVFQSKPTTPPVTNTGPDIAPPANVQMNGPSVSQAKPLTVPVPGVKDPTIAFTRPCKLVSSCSKSSSDYFEKPETISTASSSNPQLTDMKVSTPPKATAFMASLSSSSSTKLINSPTKCLPHPSSLSKPQPTDTLIKSSTSPKARTSTALPSSHTILVNSPMKGLSCPLEKPETTSIVSPSTPQQDGLSSSTLSLSFIQPTITPVSITGPVVAPPGNTRINGHSWQQAQTVSLPVPVVRPPMSLHSLPKDPYVHFGKPITTSTVIPSVPQPAVTITKPNTSPTASPSAAPSSHNRLIHCSTKGLAGPLEKTATISNASPSNPQLAVTFMKPSTLSAVGPSDAPSSPCTRLYNSPMKGSSVPLEKPSAFNPQPYVTTMKPSFHQTAGPSDASSSSCTRLNNSPMKGPSVPLERPVQSSVQSITPAPVPVICLSNLWKYCNLGNDCPDMHYYLPYRWQIYKGTDWEDLPKMEEIEKCYCDPKVDRVPLIDFLTMRSGRHRIRRLSTESSVVMPSEYVLTTEWLWYWRDENGTWTQYGHSDVNHVIVTISPSDLELRYLYKPNDVIPFVAGKNTYEINCQDMKQKNVLYKTERDVRRRPKYLSFDDVKSLKGSTKSAAIKSPLKLGTSPLNSNTYPKTWDPAAMPEIGCQKVLLSDTSSEVLSVVHLFSKTVSGHEVKKMWRLQNPSLWQVFQWQKEHMKKVNQGRDVREMRLFHGTDIMHIDAICDHNFDWRICGTHGTSFGQGSYFTRIPSYAHKFSIPAPSGTRVMFIARVLVGDYVTGNPQMKRPPPRPGSTSRYYDSCVNNTINPFIFVVFEKHQIYPEYLLEYEEQKKS